MPRTSEIPQAYRRNIWISRPLAKQGEDLAATKGLSFSVWVSRMVQREITRNRREMAAASKAVKGRAA